MQAVILAAGLGTRMRPLTNTVAKPLVRLNGRPLLDYTFDALPEEIDEVIMVIGYRGDQIRSYLGNTYRGRTIHYVLQEKLEGTAKALFETRSLLRDRFLVLMADDIYAKKDIEKLLTHERAMLVYTQERESPGGEVILGESGNLREVVEKKVIPAGVLVNMNVFVLTTDFFSYEPVKLTDREGEWGLPQTVARLSQDHPVSVVRGTRWIKITTPEDLMVAEKILSS